MTGLCAAVRTSSQSRYGVDTTRLNWYQDEYRTASGLRSIVHEGDSASSSTSGARPPGSARQDVVIVPGMGVLEATLPLRPWGFPYSLFLLSAAGRLFGTKVALAQRRRQRDQRNGPRGRSSAWPARLAAYRSYRDEPPATAMREHGCATSRKTASTPTSLSLFRRRSDRWCPGPVGVGVMAYYGGNDDRSRGDESIGPMWTR